MPQQRYDIGSKWLLHNQGKGALLVGGFRDVQRVEPMPGEAASQVMTGLRFPDPALLRLLGGREPMIESPLLQKMIAENLHEAIQEALKARFGALPRDVTQLLRETLDVGRLKQLTGIAAKCPDLQTFREALLS